MKIEAEAKPEAVSRWVLDSIKRIPDGKRERAETVKGTPGLQLISRTNGSRSWKWFYWNPDTNKTDSITFGPAKLTRELEENPTIGEPMTFGRAKELAGHARKLVKEKRDPKPVLTKLKRDIEQVLTMTWSGHKVDDLFREYVANYNYRPVKGQVARASTVEYYAARLGLKPDGRGSWEASGNGVLSHWQGKIYATRDGEVKLDYLDADTILKQMAPSISNKTVEALNRFGNWAVWAKRANSNPFADLQPIFEEEHRDRLLSEEEIKQLWQITGTTNDPAMHLYGASAQLMLLTATRAGAARRVKRSDIDRKEAIWYLPTTERRKRQSAKLGRHRIPLSPQALALLDKLPQRGEYVFSLDGLSPIPEDTKAITRRFRKAMEKALSRDYDSEPDATEDDPYTGAWQWRDMRRTAATGLSYVKLGPWSIPPHVIEAIQDHAKGSVSAVYLKNNYLDEARQALDAWGNRLTEITA